MASATAAAAVRDIMSSLGIPSDAVIVQQRSPIRAMATLRDDVSPLQGGLQLNFLNAGGVVGRPITISRCRTPMAIVWRIRRT